ncbi:MAG: Fis family transcriptional regulator [Methylococcaceae bacterium]|nr:Fis family transcriptional regulator [Methylococcaceae bacterium]
MDTSFEGNKVIEENVNLSLCTPLSVHVKQTVSRYLEQLNGHDVLDLYEMVLSEVEKPLLQAALEHSGHNQSKAAKMLGLSRSTLRKKMEFYGLA